MKEKLMKIWTKLNSLYIYMFYTLPFYCLNVNAVTVKTDESFREAFNALMDEYSTELTIVMSVGLLLSIAIFIFHCVQLNNHATNPQARKQDISNLLITGVCLALQGSVSVIMAILYYMLG